MKIRLSAALRVLGFVLGGLFALVAALALVVWIGFDANGTTTMLTHHFKERYQRTLLLHEPPQLRMWPHPVLLLRHASLSEKGSIDTFVQADSIRLDLSALSLLLRHPKVTGLSFDGVHVTLQCLSSSAWNISSFWDKPLIEASPLPWRLKPQRIIVRDLTVQVVTAQEDKPFELSIPSLDLAGLNSGKPGTLDALARFSVAGTDTRLQARSHFLVEESLKAGSLADIRLELEGVDGLMKGGKAELTEAGLHWSDFGKSIGLGSIALKTHGVVAKQRFNLDVAAQDLDWKDGQPQGRGVSLTALLQGEQGSTRMHLSLPRLLAGHEGFATQNALLSWKVLYGSRASEGTLKGNLVADIFAERYFLNAFQASGSVHHPCLKDDTVPVNLTGSLGWSREDGLQGSLQAVSGKNQLQLQPELRTLWPLSGQLNIRGGVADIDALLVSPPGRSDWQSALMGWPGQTDLRGQIQMGRLKVDGVLLEDLTLPYSISERGFRAPVYSARLAQGSIHGVFESDAESREIRSSGEFRDIDTDQLHGDSGLEMLFHGKASGSFRLSTVLAPDARPLQKLEGAVRWSMPEARLQGIDLMHSLHAMQHSVLAQQEAVRIPVAGENTRLGRVSSRFVFADGMIQAENVQTRNEWLALAGTGRVGLLDSGIELELRAALLPGMARTAARDLTKLKLHPLKLQLMGTRLHPTVRYIPESVKKPAQRAVEIKQ